MTFAEVAEEWLSTRTRARPQTVERYRRILELWVNPVFGHRPINTIRPADIGRFVNGLKVATAKPPHQPAPLRPATIARIVGPLQTVLRFAHDQEYIRKNPAAGVALPDADAMGVEPFVGHALTWAEVTRIADAAAVHDPMYGLVVRLLARTGLRASELSGLRVEDHSPGWLRVNETRTRDSLAPDGIRSGAPKSKTSRRAIPIAPDLDAAVASYLAEHPRAADPRAALFPSRWANQEWMEHHVREGTDIFNWDRPIDPGNFKRRVFDPACRRAGVGPVRLHDLRHTAGSLLLAAGVDIFHVSRILGHSSVDFTAKVYGHTYAASLNVAAATLAAYLSTEQTDNVVPIRRQA